jgi:hypothetical protein
MILLQSVIVQRPRDHFCRSTIAPSIEANDVERILANIDAHRGNGRD